LGNVGIILLWKPTAPPAHFDREVIAPRPQRKKNAARDEFDLVPRCGRRMMVTPADSNGRADLCFNGSELIAPCWAALQMSWHARTLLKDCAAHFRDERFVEKLKG
jgi:hypothetical protein